MYYGKNLIPSRFNRIFNSLRHNPDKKTLLRGQGERKLY
jgi:hypothetical protein